MGSYPTDFARFGNQSFRMVWSSADALTIRAASQHVHALGPRVLEEVFTEFARGPLGIVRVVETLEPYGHLTPALVAAVGADRPLQPRLLVVPT